MGALVQLPFQRGMVGADRKRDTLQEASPTSSHRLYYCKPFTIGGVVPCLWVLQAATPKGDRPPTVWMFLFEDCGNADFGSISGDFGR